MLYIDLDTHTLKKGRTVLILNGIPQNGYKIDPSPITLEYIEQLYEAFKYSVPNGVRYKKNYFMALPEEKLSAEELIIGENRSAAKEALELALLTGILNGSLMWPEGNTQWFIQPAPERDKDFVLLRKWFTRADNAQSQPKESEEKAPETAKNTSAEKTAEPETRKPDQTIIATNNSKQNGGQEMTSENKNNQNPVNKNAIICDGQYYPVSQEVMKLIRNYQKLMEEASEVKKNLEARLGNGQKVLAVTDTAPKETSEADTDEIEEKIHKDGYIPSHHLWRRWIMAQMMRHYRGTTANSPKETFDKYFVTGKPYRYAWTTAAREIKALSHLNGEELVKRERFFNLSVLKDMARDYKEHFWDYFYKLKIETKERFKDHKDKAKYQYRKVPWFGEVYTAYEAVSYKKKSAKYYTQHQLREIIDAAVDDILCADNYRDMSRAVTRFIKTCPVNCRLPKPKAWKNAFKGAGAYYTMDNMIKFHGCVFYRDSLNRYPLTRDESLEELEKYTNMFDNDNMEYYKLYAIMCQFIKANHFDFEKRLAELKEA